MFEGVIMNTKNIVEELKKGIGQFSIETQKYKKAEKPIKLDFKVPSTEQFTFKIDGICFFVPTDNEMKEFGIEKFSVNKNGLLLYSGVATIEYVKKIAKIYGLEADKFVFTTKNQIEQIYNNPKYKNALLKAEIGWIPFIIDKNDKNRNVSLKEYWDNPDKYCFYHRDLQQGSDWTGYNAACVTDGSAVLLSIRII